MIAFVRGEVASVMEDSVVVDTGSLGYQVYVSAETLHMLPGKGKEVRLYTYTHVREDIFQLYGFLRQDDLEMFKRLITVNGIGPKGGLAILSAMSADDLRFAIMSGDVKAISKAPGIGKKTAERMILDLRDKVSLYEKQSEGLEGAVSGERMSSGNSQAHSEAVEALVALGYPSAEAAKAVRQTDMGGEADVEEILKAALKHLV